jgi:hypothetical protein
MSKPQMQKVFSSIAEERSFDDIEPWHENEPWHEKKI